MGSAQVAVVLGSDSDWPVMERCHRLLAEFGIPVTVQVLSAHRTPERLREFVLGGEAAGIRIFIAAAGMAAALPGAIAAHTHRPVIGVPLVSGAFQGIDSLLSMVQMPPGVPVATVAVGEPGAYNAALLAAEILGVGDPRLAEAVKMFKRNQAESVDKKNQSLQERISLG